LDNPQSIDAELTCAVKPSGCRGGAVAGSMDFVAGPWLCWAMRYRIEMSQSRKGYARVNVPGRIFALEAKRDIGPVWLVGIFDLAGDAEGSVAEGAVTVRAGSAGEAVWRVARAAVRAVAEITDSPVEGTIENGSEG
jgi:hypothetical protein